MEAKEPTMMITTLLAIDHTDVSYRACSLCERALPDNPSSLCRYCKPSSFNPRFPRTKRFFRILMSVASDSKVFTVICFDKVAKVLFGCSADEFFEFAKFHPFAAANASRILEGEMFNMTISKPKNGNAQNMRANQVMPLRTGFQPAIVTLRNLYGAMLLVMKHTSNTCNVKQPNVNEIGSMETRLCAGRCSSTDACSTLGQVIWVKPRLLAPKISDGDCSWCGNSITMRQSYEGA